jgi:hypothetical protein
MKDETSAWLSYADENLAVAELSLANNHLNACLHNAQHYPDTLFSVSCRMRCRIGKHVKSASVSLAGSERMRDRR